jgi:hypothetical protein
VAKLCQELSVVFEIDAQHDRDAEDELSMGDWIEDVVGDVLPELNGLLGRGNSDILLVHRYDMSYGITKLSSME